MHWNANFIQGLVQEIQNITLYCLIKLEGTFRYRIVNAMLVLLSVMLVRDHELLIVGGQLLPGPAVCRAYCGRPSLLSVERWVVCPIIHSCIVHCNNTGCC